MVLTRSSFAWDLIPHPLRESSAEQLKVLHNCCAAGSFCSYMEAGLVVKGSSSVRMKVTPAETSSLPVSLHPLRVKFYLGHRTRSSGWVCNSHVADCSAVDCIDGVLQLSSVCFLG